MRSEFRANGNEYQVVECDHGIRLPLDHSGEST